MNIIELAKQAEFSDREIQIAHDNFAKFAALVAAHEREACAKIVEDLFVPPDEIVDFIVEKIMARGKA